MHARMHACMCARTHRSAVMDVPIYLLTAMHACMHVCTHAPQRGDVSIYLFIDRHACTDACVHVCTHPPQCGDGCIYLFIYLLTAMHGTWGLVWAHLGGGTGSSSAAKTWGLV